MSVGPPLLATGMPGSENRASAGVAHHPSDYSAACRTPSPISRTLGVLLLLVLLLLRSRRLLWGLRRRRWRPRDLQVARGDSNVRPLLCQGSADLHLQARALKTRNLQVSEPARLSTSQFLRAGITTMWIPGKVEPARHGALSSGQVTNAPDLHTLQPPATRRNRAGLPVRGGWAG